MALTGIRFRVLCTLLVTFSLSAYLLYSSLFSVAPVAPVAPVALIRDDGIEQRKGETRDNALFSERAALEITKELSTSFPRRHVSHMDSEHAAVYLKGLLDRLSEDFSAAGHHVEVHLEQVSGANGRQSTFGFEFANVYNNLTNVVMTIRTGHGESKGSKGSKGEGGKLLINAHFDSTLGTPGASDCASCVGVAVEVIRALLVHYSSATGAGRADGDGDGSSGVSSATTLPPASIVLLLNGGEETLMQAAHGFMQGSRFAEGVSSFINIESTGPWGPDVLFQYSGWTLDAYARTAPRPRGNSVAQDFFELGLIPADTDYRVLRERVDKTSVPGIDVAFLFDGLAYHTREDTWDRIRPGTLQGMGENVLAAAIEFIKRNDRSDRSDRSDRNDRSDRSDRNDRDVWDRIRAGTLQGVGEILDGHQQNKSVFVDIGARFMLVVPFSVARIIHVAPLAFYIASSLSRETGGESALSASPTALTSTFLALLLPSMLGASRAFVSGLPISWYGSVGEACLVYLPAALAGCLLPIRCKGAPKKPKVRSEREGREHSSLTPERQAQSFGAAFSVVAFAFTAAGMTSSYVSATWAWATVAFHVLASRVSPSLLPLMVVVLYTIPCYFGAGVAATTMLHVVEKIGVAGGADGTLGTLVADIVVGALAGVSTLLCVGALAPWIAFVLGEYKKPVCRMLVVLSLFAAMLSSSHRVLTYPMEPKNGVPYTKMAPKRMIIQHILRVDADGRISDKRLSACSMDVIPVSSPGILPASMAALKHEPFDAKDWVSFFPLNYLITGMTFRDPTVVELQEGGDDGAAGVAAAIPSLSRAPFLYTAKDSVARYMHDTFTAARAWGLSVIGGDEAIREMRAMRAMPTTRHYLELDTAGPAWAVLNITAEIVAWSLGEEIASVKGAPNQHVVRYASGPHTSKWQFWIDVPRNDSSVDVELFVKHFDVEPHVAQLVSEFGDHISPVALTTYQRHYTYK